jgi:hypothetical protein
VTTLTRGQKAARKFADEIGAEIDGLRAALILADELARRVAAMSLLCVFPTRERCSREDQNPWCCNCAVRFGLEDYREAVKKFS